MQLRYTLPLKFENVILNCILKKKIFQKDILIIKFNLFFTDNKNE